MAQSIQLNYSNSMDKTTGSGKLVKGVRIALPWNPDKSRHPAPSKFFVFLFKKNPVIGLILKLSKWNKKKMIVWIWIWIWIWTALRLPGWKSRIRNQIRAPNATYTQNINEMSDNARILGETKLNRPTINCRNGAIFSTPNFGRSCGTNLRPKSVWLCTILWHS